MRTRNRQDEMVAALADPVADALGFEIVRIRVLSGKRQTVQIMAEKADGTMDVEDCARLSRALSDVFETQDPISGEYVLEVSSPGIDRPLTALAHFARWEGFEAKIELDRLVENRKRFRGILAGVEEGNVLIDLEGEEETALLPFEWIAEARLVLTDALIAESLKGRGGEAPVWTEGADSVADDSQADTPTKTNR
ncbi:MAG: ribosome maturation factor RimP [Caulobacterales bacterium]|uniref:ribosome maturation factor RimP n=1 Tax=Glycocaulis sp. TaxID=1969725 RepID=UPI003F9FB751